ncbi:hypothetical protein J5U18_00565 [Sphingobacteriaceae bacterium WQ 2009]|uniref:Uncharacterized protein n=1 Tax=Rhinopithecimicrobium faecis TaxID=2820698 RepID=A0A8T4H9P3_9SPHI|nr:hypothetical protein [Sphingobacteriaceae bacterium WQ 2009]
MKIDYKVIERYHLNQCTPQERLMVEQWLDEGLDDFETPFATVNEKKQVGEEIWNELHAFMEEDTNRPKTKNLFSFKRVSVAAAILAIVSLAAITLKNNAHFSDALFDNSTNSNLKYIDKNNYELILGSYASARVNIKTGVFDTSGDIMLIPKKDFLFSFSKNSVKKALKNGEIYFLLKSSSIGRPIIISKTELTFLAPTIQQQLKMQFNIS